MQSVPHLLSESQPERLNGHQDGAAIRAMFQAMADEAKVELPPQPASNNTIAAARPGDTPLPDSVAKFMTDMGNARRLVMRHAADIRHVQEWGQMVWDGRRWAKNGDGAWMRLAKTTVLSIFDEAAEENEQAKRVAELLKDATEEAKIAELTEAKEAHEVRAAHLTAWAMKSQGESRLRAMLALAASDIEVTANAADFDKDPFMLNVENGTLDLRTGKLQPHNRVDLITCIAPTRYDPDAKCPTFDKFRSEVFMGDSELERYMQRAIGYVLTGDTREHVFFFLYGNGRNGKTTLTEAITGMLGADYCAQLPSNALMITNNTSIPNDLARMQGKRLVVASEIEKGARWAESKLKDWTGADTLTARFLHQEFFDFKPNFKLWVFGNDKPKVTSTDNSVWGRTRLVPFNASFLGREDKTLPERLKAEAPGILAWAVQGCLDWQRYGMQAPDVVMEAVASYRQEMDVLGQFIQERCVIVGNAITRASTLYKVYEQWCDDNGLNAWSNTSLGLELAKRQGVTKGRDRQGNYYQGIGLLDLQAV